MKIKAVVANHNLLLGAAVVAIVITMGSCSGSAGNRSKNKKLSDSALAVREHLDSLKRKLYRNNDISIIFLEATSEIMKAQMALEKADMQGIKQGATDSLVNSAKGDTLYFAIKHMYEIGALYAQDEDQRAAFEEKLLPAEPKPWLIKHFKGKSVEKALNTLKDFQNDCTVINRVVRR
jgi:hypothetical protein